MSKFIILHSSFFQAWNFARMSCFLNRSACGQKREIVKNLSILIVFFVSVVSAFGQEGAGLRGFVTDAKGPVKGATVVVAGADRTNKKESQTRTTDENGEFYVGFNNAGNYVVIATAQIDGQTFRSPETRLYLKFAFETTVELKLELASAINYTVTIFSLNEQPMEQISKSVNVISGQEMRDRADFTLADSLRTIPGFRVQQSGGFGRVASIKSRGLRNQDTAVLIDGIRFRDASAISGDATSFLSDITLTSVSEVEVLRGSGSSLYGTNAIGGTIDLQTPGARKGTHGQIGGAFGGLGLGRFRGNLSHGADKFGVTAGVSRTAYTKGIDGQDNASNTNFQSRIDLLPTNKLVLSGRIFFSDAKVRLNASPDTFGTLPTNTSTIINANAGVNFMPDANDPDSFQRSRSLTGQFAGTYLVNSNLKLDGHFQSSKTRRRNDDGVLGPGFQSAYLSVFDGLINTGNVRVSWTPVSFSTTTAGYEFEAEKFDNDALTPTGTSTYNALARHRSLTFFVSNTTLLLNRKLNLTGGFRAQTFSLERPTCRPSICPATFNNVASPPAAYVADGSVSYYFEKTGTKLRTHVGNGYRVPSLYERFGSYFFLGSFFPLGNPQLKPERSIAFDGGIDQKIAKGRVLLTTTYFYTEIDDEVSYLPTDDLGAPSYYNFDKHFSRGLEFSGTIRPTRSTDIFASYTFTNGDVRGFSRPTFPVGPVFSRDRKVYGVPDHQFTLTATQRYKRFWINFDLLATSSYLAPIFSNSVFRTYVYRFEGNRRGDLTAGYTFGFKNEKMTLRLFGTVENVFDQEYYENGFRTAKATGRVGLSFGF